MDIVTLDEFAYIPHADRRIVRLIGGIVASPTRNAICRRATNHRADSLVTNIVG
jgi:hypothetical protein